MHKLFLVCIGNFKQFVSGPKNAEMLRVRESAQKPRALMIQDSKSELNKGSEKVQESR